MPRPSRTRIPLRPAPCPARPAASLVLLSPEYLLLGVSPDLRLGRVWGCSALRGGGPGAGVAHPLRRAASCNRLSAFYLMVAQGRGQTDFMVASGNSWGYCYLAWTGEQNEKSSLHSLRLGGEGEKRRSRVFNCGVCVYCAGYQSDAFVFISSPARVGRGQGKRGVLNFQQILPLGKSLGAAEFLMPRYATTVNFVFEAPFDCWDGV